MTSAQQHNSRRGFCLLVKYLIPTKIIMERDSFVFYKSFYDVIQDLDAEQTRELVVAICERALNWNEIDIDDKVVKISMNLIRPLLDANTKRYVDWCKWWQHWAKGWRPPKDWNNSQKPQWGKNENPSGSELKTPNDNDDDDVTVNDDENEKGCGGKHIAFDADASHVNAVDERDRSERNVDKRDANSKTHKLEALEAKMREAGFSDKVVELIMIFDDVKKWKHLHDQKEAWVKAFISTLNTWDTEQWKINMLNSAISGPTQGIWANKYAKPTQPTETTKSETKVISSWWYNFYI